MTSRNRQGGVIVFCALALVVLLALSGLVVDGGMAFMLRSRLQTAVDGGANLSLPTVTVSGTTHVTIEATVSYPRSASVRSSSGPARPPRSGRRSTFRRRRRARCTTRSTPACSAGGCSCRATWRPPRPSRWRASGPCARSACSESSEIPCRSGRTRHRNDLRRSVDTPSPSRLARQIRAGAWGTRAAPPSGRAPSGCAGGSRSGPAGMARCGS